MSREDMRGGGILHEASPPDTIAEDFRAELVAARGCSVSGRSLMLKIDENKLVSCLFNISHDAISKAHLWSFELTLHSLLNMSIPEFFIVKHLQFLILDITTMRHDIFNLLL